MSTNQNKLIFGGGLSVLFLAMARAYAQTNSAAVPGSLPNGDLNIVSAEFYQVLNNPASMMCIPFLCVLAWLADDVPWINSRYVPHLTVALGAGLYWSFAGVSSVPKNFPVPVMVLIANGTICGFVAFIVHRQVVARVINFFRFKTGNTGFITRGDVSGGTPSTDPRDAGATTKGNP